LPDSGSVLLFFLFFADWRFSPDDLKEKDVREMAVEPGDIWTLPAKAANGLSRLREFEAD